MEIKSDDPHNFLLQHGIRSMKKRAGYVPAITEKALPTPFQDWRKRHKTPGREAQWSIEAWLRQISNWDPKHFDLNGMNLIYIAARHANYWHLIPKLSKQQSTKYAWFRDYQKLEADEVMLQTLEMLELFRGGRDETI